MMKMLALVPLPNLAGDTSQLLQHRHAAPEPQQLRRQGQLEPERAASALVQVQRDGRARSRRLQPRRGRWCVLVRWRRSWRRLHARADRGHRADLYRLADVPDRWHVRLDAVRPGRGTARSRHQLRIGRPRHSGHERSRPARKRHAAAVHVRAFQRWAIPKAGIRSTATTSPTPSTPMQAG